MNFAKALEARIAQSFTLATMPELILGPSRKRFTLVTLKAPRYPFHSHETESGKGALCPGSGCPLCKQGTLPNPYYIFLVFNVEYDRIEIMRVEDSTAPDSLLTQLIRSQMTESQHPKVYSVWGESTGVHLSASSTHVRSGAEASRRRKVNRFFMEAFLANTNLALAYADPA
ncbi:hypothetical protein D3C72_179190 [compost metagenome]